MKKYIGTKIVKAEPAYRMVIERGHEIVPVDQVPVFEERGKIEEGYKVVYPDGYVSWSPREVFEEAYRETTGMSFGLAIEAAKMGKRIARKGWGDGDVYQGVQLSIVNGRLGAEFIHKPGVRMPWVGYQNDMLADDWYIAE